MNYDVVCLYVLFSFMCTCWSWLDNIDIPHFQERALQWDASEGTRTILPEHETQFLEWLTLHIGTDRWQKACLTECWLSFCMLHSYTRIRCNRQSWKFWTFGRGNEADGPHNAFHGEMHYGDHRVHHASQCDSSTVSAGLSKVPTETLTLHIIKHRLLFNPLALPMAHGVENVAKTEKRKLEEDASKYWHVITELANLHEFIKCQC